MEAWKVTVSQQWAQKKVETVGVCVELTEFAYSEEGLLRKRRRIKQWNPAAGSTARQSTWSPLSDGKLVGHFYLRRAPRR